VTDPSPILPPPKPRKPSWPLFLLAGLSLIPGFGFFIGSVAAGWGLVSSRPKALIAAAVGAGGAMLNLVGFLVLGSSIGNNPAMLEARLEITRQYLVEVVDALETYRREQGQYPPSLLAMQQKFGLRRPVSIFDPSAGLLGFKPFHYTLAPDGKTYDLFAVGPDGEPGTADDMRPQK